MADKKIEITGEVKIDQAGAKAGFEDLKNEIAGFKSGFSDLQSSIGLVLRSLKAIALEMHQGTTGSKEAAAAMDTQAKATEQASAAMGDLSDATDSAQQETESLSDAFVGGVKEGIEKAVVESKKLDDNTQKASASASIFRGVWERIGHTIVDGAVSALRGLINYLVSALEQANEFDVVMDRMAARGVEGMDSMRVAIVDLAAELGTSHVELAKTVDLAESLGAGSEAVDVAAAAWENYRVTGMDVNTQVQISTRLARGFNLQMGEQADLIMQVATAAQNARVDQAALWNGMSAMAPRIQQIGGSMKDLLELTKAGIAGGLKAEEEGLQGQNELIAALAKPTKEFGEALVKAGIIITETSPKWTKMKDQVSAQKDAFDKLNAEIKEYREQANEIGLLASQAERTADQFEKLQAKRDAGIRLNRLERVAWRESKEAVRDYKSELSQFDEAGLIAGGKQWRRLSDVEQLRARIDAAKEAQKDLNLASQQAQMDADEAGGAYAQLNQTLEELSTKMATEIPNAIKTAISQGGLGDFLTKLSQAPEALGLLSAETQTMVKTVSGNFKGVSAELGKVGKAIGDVAAQFKKMSEQGTDGLGKFKQSVANLASEVVSPLNDVLNKVGELLRNKLYEPLADGSTMAQKVQAWAMNLSAELLTDMEMVAAGETTLWTVFWEWIDRALGAAIDALVPIIKKHIARFWEDLKDEFMNGQPDIEKWLADQLANLAKKAVPAIGNAIGGFLDEHVGGAADWWMDKLGVNQGTAQTGVLNLGGTAGTSTGSTNIYVNGAQDPGAVADEVARRQARNERLGYSGSRVR